MHKYIYAHISYSNLENAAWNKRNTCINLSKACQHLNDNISEPVLNVSKLFEETGIAFAKSVNPAPNPQKIHETNTKLVKPCVKPE